MALDLLRERGVPLDQQRFTWKDLVQEPYCTLTDDAFTRVRVILMNGIESEALRFSHACARMNADLQPHDQPGGSHEGFPPRRGSIVAPLADHRRLQS